MKKFSKVAKHLPVRSGKRPGDKLSGRDEKSFSRHPFVSDDIATAPGQDIDLWTQAYVIFQNQQLELTADYEKHLASLQSGSAFEADLSSPQFVEATVKRLLKDREDKQWHVSLLGKDIKVQEQVEN